MLSTTFLAVLALGLLPGIASAADPVRVAFDAADRSMEPGIDAQMIVWVTIFSVLALFAISSIGYLYRRERGLDWEFQKPDAPHDDHH